MKKARIISSMRNPSFCFYRPTESYILYMINPRLEIKQSGRGFLSLSPIHSYILYMNKKSRLEKCSSEFLFSVSNKLESCGNLQPHFKKEVIKPTKNQSPDNRMHFIMPLISPSVVKRILKGGIIHERNATPSVAEAS